MNEMLSGALALASFVAALFFLRFWRNTRDRFFVYFALSFAIEGLNRIGIGLLDNVSEDHPLFYGARVIAYGLIVAAIWRKNRGRG